MKKYKVRKPAAVEMPGPEEKRTVPREMTTSLAAELLARRAGYIRQAEEELNDSSVTEFRMALEYGARALLRELGVDAFDAE